MTKTEKLIDLLNNDIIPEIEDVIDGLLNLSMMRKQQQKR